MSRGLNNPKAFSTQDEAENPTITAPQITDASDFPHTGLIKALSLGMRGNYATTGFNATSVTDVAVTFANGVVFRDGEEVGVTGSTITIGSTTGTTTAHTTGYHLVVNETGTTTLTVRPPTSADAVPAYDDDDVIIAILGYTGNTPLQIQYLTVNKSKNSLSIARSNGGTYTEMSKITAASGGTTVEVATAGGDFTIDNTDADKKIIMRLGSDDANTDFEVRNNSDAVKFGVDGAGTTTIAGTVNLGSVVNAGTDTDKFLVLDSGGNVDFRTGTEVRSDIGAGTLSAESDTLDTVTGRGNTTANDITAGSIASTVNQNISFELITAGQPITGGKTVVYAFQLSGPVALPAPATGNILYIVNIDPAGPITINGTPLINNGDATHPKLTAPNVITLNPFETVTLQAVNDVGGVIQTGHMIISD